MKAWVKKCCSYKKKSVHMLWESCLEFDFEQLSHSMSVPNLARLAVAIVALFFV